MAADRIASLTLVSTAARVRIDPIMTISAILPRTIAAKLEWVKAKVFSPEYLSRPDDTEYAVQPFPSNGDRFASAELQKRSNPGCWSQWGHFSQAWAAGWHEKSPGQLVALGDAVGRERICIVHGTDDQVITVDHGEGLLRYLGGQTSEVTVKFFEGAGHLLHIECRRAFRETLAHMVNKGRGLSKN